jgi:hypothetical protein
MTDQALQATGAREPRGVPMMDPVPAGAVGRETIA